jgi:putative Ca2+/H+ antiporter (TMEM165/GDT1 family)
MTMNWNLFAMAFATVFVAELGDKTQIATLALASGSQSKWAVFAGSALALAATSFIAVIAGDAITRVISPLWLKRGAGAVFVVLGVLYLLDRA